jgi:DNA-binding response OmpR family regulator
LASTSAPTEATERIGGAVLRAVVIISDVSRARPILEALSRRGFAGIIESDPKAVLDAGQVNPPDLLIVEDRLNGMTGSRLLSEFLAIAWTTAAILICDEDEETVHQRTEGLGILGHMRTVKDVDKLDELLDTFLEIASHKK